MANVPEVLLDNVVTLRRYRESDVDEVKASVEASFSELHTWFPWAADRPTLDTIASFIAESIAKFGDFESPENQTNFAITTTDDGRFLGSCGLMPRIGAGALEIGYWVDTRFTGRGIATAAARSLAHTALALAHIELIHIRCDEANERSAAVARKVGCTLDRIQDKEPQAPGETGREMVWILSRGDS